MKNSTQNTVDYLDGFQTEARGSQMPVVALATQLNNNEQYAGNVLQFFPTSEGYVKATRLENSQTEFRFNYIYNYTDHLGNVRVSYTLDPQTGKLRIVDEHHYYPFGLRHEVHYPSGNRLDFHPSTTLNGGQVGDPVQLINVTKTEYMYKYNGKEWQDELGLNFYDYGWRNYDPAIGRWHVVDPLAEEFPEWSPYSYGFNNPLRFTDPTGMAPEDIIIRGKNNSSVTIKTDLVDISVNAGSVVGDLGGNYTLQGDDVLIAALDIVGIVDPTGVADIAAASLEAKNGNWGSALLSGMGVIPYVGDIGKAGKVGKHLKTIEKAIDGAKAKNLAEAAEKGIPKSQLGPSGKPKIHTVSKPNQKQAKDTAKNNPKSNTKPVKHSSDKGQKTHYHSTKDGKKMSGKDNIHYEDRSSKKN